MVSENTSCAQSWATVRADVWWLLAGEWTSSLVRQLCKERGWFV